MNNKDFLKLEYTKEDNNFRLQLLFATDERGIVYKISSVLYANNWNILGASIRSFENGQIEDEFIIHSEENINLDEKEIEKLKAEIQQLFREEISISSFLIKKGKGMNVKKGIVVPKISFEAADNQDITKLRIQTKDRPGLLYDITRIFYLECIDILSVQANTIGDNVDDIFEIKSEFGHSLDEGMKTRLSRNLNKAI